MILNSGKLFGIINPSILQVKWRIWFLFGMRKNIYFFQIGFFILGLFLSDAAAQAPELSLNSPFKKCWEYQEESIVHVASDNAKQIVILSADGLVKALSENGQENWETEIGGSIIHPPVLDEDTLYVLSLSSSKPLDSNSSNSNDLNNFYFLSAIETGTGVTRWRKTIPESLVPPKINLSYRKLYLYKGQRFEDQRLEIIAVDPSTGNDLKESISSYQQNLLSFYSKQKSFSGFGKNVYLRNPEDQEEWSFNELILKDFGTTWMNEDFIAFGDQQGYLYLFERFGAIEKFKVKLGGKITGINFYDNKFFVSSLDNFLYALSPDGHRTFWKKRLAGRITFAPMIYKKTIAVSSIGEPTLYFIDTDDGNTINQIIIEDGEFIASRPLLINDKVILTTVRGIKAFSQSSCSTAQKISN